MDARQLTRELESLNRSYDHLACQLANLGNRLEDLRIADRRYRWLTSVALDGYDFAEVPCLLCDRGSRPCPADLTCRDCRATYSCEDQQNLRPCTPVDMHTCPMVRDCWEADRVSAIAEDRERDPDKYECRGHESLAGAIGSTFYCDGSCREGCRR